MSQQKITILNSRQGLYPCRLHIWIQKTKEALQSLQHSQPIILSSIGMSTWDIVTILASELKLPLKLYIQKDDRSTEEELIEKIILEFNLNQQQVTFEFIHENSNKDFQTKRDQLITSSADTIFSISVRENGNLAKLITQHTDKVDNSYSIPYKKRKEKFAYTLDASKTCNTIQNITESYIIHWTKTSSHKWYNERQYEYYTDILDSNRYPRHAINTLQNIIKTQTIIATPTHMPENIPTVSFTSLSPIEMIQLFRWRSRYKEMSFEPYGIGIQKSVALQNNIREVLYYNKEEKEKFAKDELWLTQSNGMVTNWELEKEFRHLDDFNFSNIPKKDIMLFTRYKKEADQLQKLTGYNTISFLE